MSESEKPWSREAQARRRAEVAAHCREVLRPHLMADGKRADDVLAHNWDTEDRLRAWAALAFLQGDAADGALGNALIRSVVVSGGIDRGEGVWPICEFELLPCINACYRYADRLETETRQMVKEWVGRSLQPLTTRDSHFMGYNDNFPIMSTHVLILGGQLAGRKESVKQGRANLLELRSLLTRRGTPSEFGVGYWTHRLEPIAGIASDAEDDEIRRVAVAIEERLWAEVVFNWHPVLKHQGGASARGMGPESVQTILHMYHVFGREVELAGLDHWSALDGPGLARRQRAYGLEPKTVDTYMLAYANGFAHDEYHVPDRLAQFMYHKPYPFNYSATAEVGPWTDRFYHTPGSDGKSVLHVKPDAPFYAGHSVVLRTHFRPHFVLGSSSTQFYCGSISRPWHLQYARRDRAENLSDLGNWECRYVINDKPVGKEATYWDSPDHARQAGGPVYPAGWDEGRSFILQHEGATLCLTRPKYREHWAVTSLRQDVALSQHFGSCGQIHLGNHHLANRVGESQHSETIFINEETVFIAFRPLVGRFLGREVAIRIREENRYLVLSFYNYRGPARSMTAYEMAYLGNGFVCEVAEAGDYGSFDEFCKTMLAAEVLDDTHHGARTVRYARDELELAMAIDPVMEHIIFATINGRARPEPQLAATGIECQTLPFLGHDQEQRGKTNLSWAKPIHERPDGQVILDYKKVWRP